MNEQFKYECPLLNKKIEDSFCLEINYEYLEMFKTEILKEYSINKQHAKEVCLKCKFYPLDNNK